MAMLQGWHWGGRGAQYFCSFKGLNAHSIHQPKGWFVFTAEDKPCYCLGKSKTLELEFNLQSKIQCQTVIITKAGTVVHSLLLPLVTQVWLDVNEI